MLRKDVKVNLPSDDGDFRYMVILGIGALRCMWWDSCTPWRTSGGHKIPRNTEATYTCY
jgi:hypothetical protein